MFPVTKKILFYEDPLTDFETFLWRDAHIDYDAAIYAALAAEDIECRMLLDERFVDLALAGGVKRGDLVPVCEADWQALLDDPLVNLNTLLQRYVGPAAERSADPGENFHARAARVMNDRIGQHVANLLGGYRPDVIISWLPVPFLRDIYPDALILNRESAMFTRLPYQLSYFLDPCGLQERSWPAHHSLPRCSDVAIAELRRLRAYYSAVFALLSPLAKLRERLSPFRKTVLVIGQFVGTFSLDACAAFRSQVHMLLEVLDHVPPDYAVIFAQHPNTPKRVSQETLDTLRLRYPNLIHDKDFLDYPAISQDFMTVCDIVATVSSSAGWQATFWGKPLVALGRSQLNAFAQGVGGESITQLSDEPDTDNAAAWLAFHHGIPMGYLNRPGWVAAYLQQKYDLWRISGVDGYYDAPYDDPVMIADDMIRGTQHYLQGLHPYDGKLDDGISHVNFHDDFFFRRGWSFSEGSVGGGYRWIDGKSAEVSLLLDQPLAHEVSMLVGTHEGCDDQYVSLSINGRATPPVFVSAEPAVWVKIDVQPNEISFPLTSIEMHAAQASPTASDRRSLSLICVDIQVCRMVA